MNKLSKYMKLLVFNVIAYVFDYNALIYDGN